MQNEMGHSWATLPDRLPWDCLYWVFSRLLSSRHLSLSLPYSLSLLLFVASWLQYRQCYCYLSRPLSYFILSLRFCQLLAVNRYKNSPLVVMKDIKMQRGLWALWVGLLTFAEFAAQYWPQHNKTLLGKIRTEKSTWVTNDRSVSSFEEVERPWVVL